MTTTGSKKTNRDAAYDSFANVDKLVNKPVLGSDGAASWQAFRLTTGTTNRQTSSCSGAPTLQVKRNDRLGTGLASIEDERAHDNAIRMAAGDGLVGAGYVNFKQKITAEEVRKGKETKRIQKRQRPEDKEYFLQTGGQFQGHKFDYVFTTKDGRTGYYWDGMDSLNQLNGVVVTPYSKTGSQGSTEECSNSGTDQQEVVEQQPRKKKKKSKSAESVQAVATTTTTIPSDSMNHREIVANAIQKQLDAMNRPPGWLESSLPQGWQQTMDPTSQKIYYYNDKTGLRQWEKPTIAHLVETPLPDGWKCANDASTGKEYYYHANGETKWERPT